MRSYLLIAASLTATLWAHTGPSQSAGVGLITGYCLPPDAPYPHKLLKSDPLYDTALDEHQKHLENMEHYVNCLDRERGTALDQLKSSFDLFLKNFGKDAVLKFADERQAVE